MTNRFYLWLRRKLQNAYDPAEQAKEILASGSERHGNYILRRESAIRFTVHRADGGWVIEYTQRVPHTAQRGLTVKSSILDDYDEQTFLHIVTDQSDLGNEIAKIMTHNALRA